MSVQHFPSTSFSHGQNLDQNQGIFVSLDSKRKKRIFKMSMPFYLFSVIFDNLKILIKRIEVNFISLKIIPFGMKDCLGNRNSYYFNYLENNYNIHLGVADKYLVNKVLNNVNNSLNEPPNNCRALDLTILPLYPNINSKLRIKKLKKREALEVKYWQKQINI